MKSRKKTYESRLTQDLIDNLPSLPKNVPENQFITREVNSTLGMQLSGLLDHDLSELGIRTRKKNASTYLLTIYDRAKYENYINTNKSKQNIPIIDLVQEVVEIDNYLTDLLPPSNDPFPASRLNFANYQNYAPITSTPYNLFSYPLAAPFSPTPQQYDTADLDVRASREVNSTSDETSDNESLTVAPISTNNELPLTFAPVDIDKLVIDFKLAIAEKNNMEVHSIWNKEYDMRARYYWHDKVPHIPFNELIYDFQLLLAAKDTVTAVTYAIWVNNLIFKSWYRGERINLGSDVQATNEQLLLNFKTIALSGIGHLTFTMLEGNQRLIGLISSLDTTQFQSVLDCMKDNKDDFQKRKCLDLIKNLIEMQKAYEMRNPQSNPLNLQRLAFNLAALNTIYPPRPTDAELRLLANRMLGSASTPETRTPIQLSMRKKI